MAKTKAIFQREDFEEYDLALGPGSWLDAVSGVPKLPILRRGAQVGTCLIFTILPPLTPFGPYCKVRFFRTDNTGKIDRGFQPHGIDIPLRATYTLAKAKEAALRLWPEAEAVLPRLQEAMRQSRKDKPS